MAFRRNGFRRNVLHPHKTCASVTQASSEFSCVANWSRRFQTCLKILCEFFRQNISQDCCATVVRRSCECREPVAAKFWRINNAKFWRHSYECRASVVRDGRATGLRKHAIPSRLSGEKIKLNDIRTNVARLSYE